MTFSAQLLQKLAATHLLKHPFYRAWNAGELKLDQLQGYARQYFHHVDAFPRYVSATHSNCTDIHARQVLLQNLNDEESGPENHPELWMRFADGLGVKRPSISQEKLNPETRELVDTFMTLCRSSYEEGLGALFAYEHQVPEVAANKIDGLKKFYGISDDRSLQFFTVHLKADVYHAKAAAELMDSLSPEQRTRAEAAAQKAAKALWKFLDGVQVHQCNMVH